MFSLDLKNTNRGSLDLAIKECNKPNPSDEECNLSESDDLELGYINSSLLLQDGISVGMPENIPVRDGSILMHTLLNQTSISFRPLQKNAST